MSFIHFMFEGLIIRIIKAIGTFLGARDREDICFVYFGVFTVLRGVVGRRLRHAGLTAMKVS